MLVKRVIFCLLLLVCGACFWFVKNKTGVFLPKIKEEVSWLERFPIKIGQEVVKFRHLQIEAGFLRKTIFEGKSEEENNIFESFYLKKEEALKLSLRSILKRKIMVDQIKKEEGFSLDSAALKVECDKALIDSVPSPQEHTLEVREYLREKICENTLIKYFANEYLYKGIKVERHEIENYFNNNLDMFNKNVEVIIRQIVFKTEKEAQKIWPRLNRKNFAEFAERYSDSPESSEGGLLPKFKKGDMPRVFDVAFSMRVGKISGILKSTYGFHIFLLEKSIKAKKADISLFYGKIEQYFLVKKRKEKFSSWAKSALATENLNQIDRMVVGNNDDNSSS